MVDGWGTLEYHFETADNEDFNYTRSFAVHFIEPWTQNELILEADIEDDGDPYNTLTDCEARSLENELMHALGGPRSINPNSPLRNEIQGVAEGNPRFLELEFAASTDLLIDALRRAGLMGR
jgi:hypothetical protein